MPVRNTTTPADTIIYPTTEAWWAERPVGATVGAAVGASVGAVVGASVGASVGAKVAGK